MPINICNFRNIKLEAINTTSRSKNWSQGLSPFFLGPVELYNGFIAQNVENGWQFSKVYKEHVDYNDDPTLEYFEWAQDGWNNPKAIRYPMGKGVKPLYSYWSGKKYTYTEARKKIYCPLYAVAVIKTKAFDILKQLYEQDDNIWLLDFDGYDFRSKGMTYLDVINNEELKMGHAFVLAMLLENKKVWEE